MHINVAAGKTIDEDAEKLVKKKITFWNIQRLVTIILRICTLNLALRGICS